VNLALRVLAVISGSLAGIVLAVPTTIVGFWLMGLLPIVMSVVVLVFTLTADVVLVIANATVALQLARAGVKRTKRPRHGMPNFFPDPK
jgi:membrane protein implicated in regulation of membrane protease activity